MFDESIFDDRQKRAILALSKMYAEKPNETFPIADLAGPLDMSETELDVFESRLRSMQLAKDMGPRQLKPLPEIVDAAAKIRNPDLVEQFRRLVSRHRVWAWVIIVYTIALAAFTLWNSGFDAIAKFFSLFK